LAVVVAVLLGGVGLASAKSKPDRDHKHRRCGVESADVVDGGALYDEATSKLTFRLTLGGATCPSIRYRMQAYDDDVATTPLGRVVLRGDGETTNPDETDFLFFEFDGVPAGDLIFCFVANTRAGRLFDRAPDTGRFCFDTSGSGSGGGRMR
jgi:hypothetical protein